jgi:hypothetical protein
MDALARLASILSCLAVRVAGTAPPSKDEKDEAMKFLFVEGGG